MKIWIETQTVDNNRDKNGDVIFTVNDIYFFRRSAISNETGFHFEANNEQGDGFELHIEPDEFQSLITSIMREMVDEYATEKEE